MNKTGDFSKLQKMVFLAVLTALIILMTFTGIGYIPIGPLKLTLNTLPVAVGAVILGPVGGAVLGLVFGLSSFFTCFGLDPLGTVLIGQNAFLMFIVCVIPRIICGVVPAWIFRIVSKRDKSKIISSAVSCTLTAILNTIGFLLLLWLCFGASLASNPATIEVLGGQGISNIIVLFAAFAGTNAIIEAATELILGTAICKALFATLKRLK